MAHGELLRMFKMPTIKVQAMLTVRNNCDMCSPRYLLVCVSSWTVVAFVQCTESFK